MKVYVLYLFIVFFVVLGAFGKFGHTSYRKQVQVNNPKVGELQFF